MKKLIITLGIVLLIASFLWTVHYFFHTDYEIVPEAEAIMYSRQALLNAAFDATNSRLRLKPEAADRTDVGTVFSELAIWNSLWNDDVNAFTVAFTGEMNFTPARDTVVTSDANLFVIDADELLTGTTGRTFVLKIDGSRPDGSQFTTGGDDASLKLSAVNYNTTAQNNYTLRGINIDAKNRNGGNLGSIMGGHIAVTQKASSPTVTNLIGLNVTVEQDSPNTTIPTNIFGLQVRYDAVMAAPANSAGIRVYVDSDTGLTDPTAAVLVDNSAADRAWKYGIYMDTNTISVADIYLENGETIDNATDGQIQFTGRTKTTNGIVMAFVTADPCGGAGYPEGALFYNDTSDYPCFCDASGVDKKVSDNGACF